MQCYKSAALNKSQDGPWLGKLNSEGEFKNVTRNKFLHFLFFFFLRKVTSFLHFIISPNFLTSVVNVQRNLFKAC